MALRKPGRVPGCRPNRNALDGIETVFTRRTRTRYNSSTARLTMRRVADAATRNTYTPASAELADFSVICGRSKMVPAVFDDPRGTEGSLLDVAASGFSDA